MLLIFENIEIYENPNIISDHLAISINIWNGQIAVNGCVVAKNEDINPFKA